MIRQLVSGSIRLIPWRIRTSIKHIPGLAWLQRQVVAVFLNGHEFVHRIDAGPAAGLTFPVLFPDDKAVWAGTYEVDFVSRLRAAVQPGDVCFDIGGWHGYCAGVMACAGASQTFVFEPLPANCTRIRRLLALNPQYRIDLETSAVADRDGTVQFQIMPESSMGKLDHSPFQAAAANCDSVDVPAISLDSFCEQRGVQRVDVLKLDVEGAELLALRGAAGILRRCRPQMFIEAHSRELARDVGAYLAELNYQVLVMETGRVLDGVSEPPVCHLEATPAALPQN